MARLNIDTGTAGNRATGDTLRTAMEKVNTNFGELAGNLNLLDNTLLSANTNGNIILDQNGTGYVEIKGNKVMITGTLPTSDPSLAGQLWRSGTDLKISVG